MRAVAQPSASCKLADHLGQADIACAPRCTASPGIAFLSRRAHAVLWADRGERGSGSDQGRRGQAERRRADIDFLRRLPQWRGVSARRHHHPQGLPIRRVLEYRAARGVGASPVAERRLGEHRAQRLHQHRSRRAQHHLARRDRCGRRNLLAKTGFATGVPTWQRKWRRRWSDRRSAGCRNYSMAPRAASRAVRPISTGFARKIRTIS